jgi:hypothetical protein
MIDVCQRHLRQHIIAAYSWNKLSYSGFAFLTPFS